VSCIGCRKCFKAAEEGQIEMDGFLAKVNYDNSPGTEIVGKAACPTGCLHTPEAHMKERNKKENAA
jgi:Na+-translocating ferredoxin:NAD+ oxidoreductase RNF subunit RnfB